MSNAIAPTPTEYKGIRFRSKSEAVFARFLDLVVTLSTKVTNSDILTDFWYEPDNASLEFVGAPLTHSWDFILPLTDFNFLVEYKPQRPTETYIDNLREKVCKHYTGRKLVSKLVNDMAFTGNDHLRRERFSRRKPSEIINVALNLASKTTIQIEDMADVGQPVGHLGTYSAPLFIYVVHGSPWRQPGNDGCCYESIRIDQCAIPESLESHFDVSSHSFSEMLGFSDSTLNELAQEAKTYRFDLPG